VHLITDAIYLDEYKLMLFFKSGNIGLADLQPYLNGEMFEPLKDVNYFKTVRVNPNIDTIVWDNRADFAPEFLFEISQGLSQTEATALLRQAKVLAENETPGELLAKIRAAHPQPAA